MGEELTPWPGARAAVGITDPPLSPHEIRMGQILFALTLVVFVGVRFIPTRFRQPAGLVLTAGYLLSVAAFTIYLLMSR